MHCPLCSQTVNLSKQDVPAWWRECQSPLTVHSYYFVRCTESVLRDTSVQAEIRLRKVLDGENHSGSRPKRYDAGICTSCLTIPALFRRCIICSSKQMCTKISTVIHNLLKFVIDKHSNLSTKNVRRKNDARFMPSERRVEDKRCYYCLDMSNENNLLKWSVSLCSEKM